MSGAGTDGDGVRMVIEATGTRSGSQEQLYSPTLNPRILGKSAPAIAILVSAHIYMTCTKVPFSHSPACLGCD